MTARIVGAGAQMVANKLGHLFTEPYPGSRCVRCDMRLDSFALSTIKLHCAEVPAHNQVWNRIRRAQVRER
jgi:hypothetical protein